MALRQDAPAHPAARFVFPIRLARLLEIIPTATVWLIITAPVWAAIVAPAEGQRMAALPCALAAKALLEGMSLPGACTVYELLGAEQMLRDLVAGGFALRND